MEVGIVQKVGAVQTAYKPQVARCRYMFHFALWWCIRSCSAMKNGNLRREYLLACYQDRQMSGAESSAVPDLADYEVYSHHPVSLMRVGLRDHRYQRMIHHAIGFRRHQGNCQLVVRPSRLSQTTACCLQEWHSWPFPVSVSMCKYIIQIKNVCLHQDHRLYRCFHHAHSRLFPVCLRCPVRWP
jgi:hypothetical protein